MNVKGKDVLVIVVIACLVAAVFGASIYATVGPYLPGYVDPDATDTTTTTTIPTDVAWSSFKYTGVRKDATATTVTSATSRVWFDLNLDGIMQYSELGSFTEASGVYTSDMEYPIGLDFDLWVQVYATSYQVTYEKVHMTGQRNSDGSAKNIGQIEIILTDDSITWSGRMNGVDFDTTDYNATLSGTTGTLDAEMTLSAADYGLSSQIWEGIDYMSVYQETKVNDYLVKWDTIAEGDNDAIAIAKASYLAPTFFCAYATEAHKVTGQINVAEFDINYADGTNWYCINILTENWGDLFYNTADSSAPRPTVSFGMGTISASGTFLATYGIGLWQGVTYDEMMAGSWTKGTDLALGTCGDAWGWTVV